MNWAYVREHDAASTMPPFSPRRPVQFVKLLLGNRNWLVGFAAESAGFLVYVAALRLAPLSLVQAIGASGIAVLAVASAHGHPSRLLVRERLAAALAVAGLVTLSLSLVDAHQADHAPDGEPIALWLGLLAGIALLLALLRLGLARTPAFGIAAGLLFAAGDISAKLVGYGGVWLFAIPSLVVCYMLGTSILQGAYQSGDALTAAGLATLVTNAVPIAAGFVVFGEELPGGGAGTLQIAGFAALVASAALLARKR